MRRLITMEIILLLSTQGLLLQGRAVDKNLKIGRQAKPILVATEWSKSGGAVGAAQWSSSKDRRKRVYPRQNLITSQRGKQMEKQLLQTNRRDLSSNSGDTKSAMTGGARNTQNKTNEWRGRRYAYEDTHEWPKDDSLDYDFDEKGETDEPTLWQEIADNWQVTIVRGMFIFSAGIMFLFILCCCCKVWCRVCCQSMKESCIPCGGFLDILTSFYEDPMYKKAKGLAELLGLKLDYPTFMKIKDRFELEGTGTYNPLGMPWMQ